MEAPGRPSLTALALRFLRIGATAFGGPVVQIAALHEEFVVGERQVDEARFRRALAVCQALPGPEATEMCIWLGTTLRGRLGGLIAGFGFVLPGLLLMLLASWLLFALDPWPPLLVAAFTGMQAAVVALVMRAAWRLSAAATHGDAWLRAIAITAALGALLSVPFAASLVGGGVLTAVVRGGRTRWRTFAIVAIPCAWLVIGALHHDAANALAADHTAAGPTPALGQVFATGLRAGLLTFGGAYTAIPFLHDDATGAAGWLTEAQFLSGLAVGGVIPAPMVIVGTWVGWAGGGCAGALLLTLGIFLPAFVLPLLLHEQLERLVANRWLHAFLDGVTAAVVGLVIAVVVQMLTTLTSPVPIAVAAGAFATLWFVRNRFAVLPVMAAAAVAGMCGS